MNITISILEVASELAELKILEEQRTVRPRIQAEDLYDGDMEDNHYKDEFQDIFNQYYSYYYDLLMSLKTK